MSSLDHRDPGELFGDQNSRVIRSAVIGIKENTYILAAVLQTISHLTEPYFSQHCTAHHLFSQRLSLALSAEYLACWNDQGWRSGLGFSWRWWSGLARSLQSPDPVWGPENAIGMAGTTISWDQNLSLGGEHVAVRLPQELFLFVVALVLLFARPLLFVLALVGSFSGGRVGKGDPRLIFQIILTLRVFIIRLPILSLTHPERLLGSGMQPCWRGVVFDGF